MYYEENLSTLKYANQASKIKNKPIINIDEKVLQIRELKEKVRMLQGELKNANDHIEFISRVNNMEVKKFGLKMFPLTSSTPSELKEALKVSIA